VWTDNAYEGCAENLDADLKDLHQRLRTGRYRAPAVRRVDGIQTWGKAAFRLKPYPEAGRTAKEAAQRLLREDCTAPWVCSDASRVPSVEGVVLGTLNPRYPLNAPRGERYGGKPPGRVYDRQETSYCCCTRATSAGRRAGKLQLRWQLQLAPLIGAETADFLREGGGIRTLGQ
jgi:hypothetical protein